MSTICYEIDKVSKAMLMEKFSPKYPEAKYDHITICMGGLEAQTPEPAEMVEVVEVTEVKKASDVEMISDQAKMIKDLFDGKIVE